MTIIDDTITQQWDAGTLGRDMMHAKRVSNDVDAEVDQALAMKLVTIRLPVPMIEALKSIAQFHGIGYQPMVRDLLGRFVRSEVRTILQELSKEADTSTAERTAPVDSFMEKRSGCG